MFPFEPLEVYTLFDSVLPTSTGIYAIVNITNGKFYIGSARAQGNCPSARGFRYRFCFTNGHRKSLLRGDHHCKHLQKSFNYYVRELGYEPNDVYEMWILEYVKPDLCLSVEQEYLDFYKPTYNVSTLASGADYERTPEIRANISRAAKNRVRPVKEPNYVFDTPIEITVENPKPKNPKRIVKNPGSMSEERRLAQKELLKGNKCAKRQSYVAISPEGEFIYFVNAKAFCASEFGKKYKFSRSKISNCAKGLRPFHRGFQFFYVDDLFSSVA